MAFTSVYAVSGITTALARAQMPSFLAAQTGQPEPKWVLVNLGANDMPSVRSGAITEAAWESDTGTLIDTVHASWPTAQIRLMRTWRPSFQAESNLLAQWLTVVLATRASFAAVGPDERVFLVGHMLGDPHPDAQGYSLTAAQWRAVIGF